MAINDDIHHTDMNWVGILCYQISPFPAPFHFRRSIFGNKADICWSPEQLDTRFYCYFQRVRRFVARSWRNIFNIQPED